MKKLLFLFVIVLASCVKVETKDAAHEASELIRDGVKEGYNLYKESKKDTTSGDTLSVLQKLKNNLKPKK